MTVSQKVLFSFLLSALLCAGIAVFAVIGVFTHYAGLTAIASESANILIFLTIFLTSFLTIFFCFNLRRDSAEKPEKLQTVEESRDANVASAEAVQVESITGLGGSVFMFRQPFTFTPHNPELLQGVENADTLSEVVYEQDGIHYINNNVFADDKDQVEFDSNFANLVESVVNKKELML